MLHLCSVVLYCDTLSYYPLFYIVFRCVMVCFLELCSMTCICLHYFLLLYCYVLCWTVVYCIFFCFIVVPCVILCCFMPISFICLYWFCLFILLCVIVYYEILLCIEICCGILLCDLVHWIIYSNNHTRNIYSEVRKTQ